MTDAWSASSEVHELERRIALDLLCIFLSSRFPEEDAQAKWIDDVLTAVVPPPWWCLRSRLLKRYAADVLADEAEAYIRDIQGWAPEILLR